MDAIFYAHKRFVKPWHFFTMAGDKPQQGLELLFQNFSPREINKELNHWLALAMCNDGSAYQDGASRENLIDFVKALQRLNKALYIWKDTVEKFTEAKVCDAIQVIRKFRKTFRKNYVEMELLDLLDAVVTYNGRKKLRREEWILFYVHLSYLVRAAYQCSLKKNR